jgi:hypothetical protein
LSLARDVEQSEEGIGVQIPQEEEREVKAKEDTALEEERLQVRKVKRKTSPGELALM